MNLHKYYYKEYFKGAIFSPLLEDEDATLSDISEKNKFLCSPNLLHEIRKNPIVNHVIPLQIAYPGLVTGVGIDHEAKITGEFKLGVHFDWTYGMPIVYGSSVKGVLRNAFIAKIEKGKIVEYEDYYLKKVAKGWDWSPRHIKTLFDAIFEGKDSKGNNLSIYERDIFFDAVITKPDSKRRILCSDSITPHGGETHDNPLKNPTPLAFLKIAPGCTLEFRFKLNDTKVGDETFKADTKLALFKEILTTVGIGAKTNVGYGQLKE